RPSARGRPIEAVIGTPGSAQERLAAGSVADDEQGVLVDGVPGHVEETRAAGRRALPDPPPIVRVEAARLVLDRLGQALALRGEAGDRRVAIGLRLALVRVVLADVRGHGPLLWLGGPAVGAGGSRA